MPFRDSNSIEAFLEHEHRRGWLVDFCHVDLKDIIILDPTLLAGFFSMLLREQPNHEIPSSGLVIDGRMHEIFIQEAAAKAFNVQISDDFLATMSKILMHLHIMFHYERDLYFIPCLLPHREDRENLTDSQHHEKAPTLRLSFADAFIPPAFFHLLTASLNEGPDFTVYKKNESPRVYNLFTCFCFQRNTLWLEVYWHDCCILFELKNYSVKISELKSNKMLEAIGLIQNRIEHILRVHRQYFVQYVLEVECVKHPSCFVSLQEAREKGEVMCSDTNEIHSILWNSMNHFLPSSHISSLGGYHTRPSDKDLGRLARFLSGENAQSLASKLELPRGNILADRVISEWESNADMQRLKLLCDWRQINDEQSLIKLLELLTKQKDYDTDRLTETLERKIIHTKHYGVSRSVLDSLSPENKDLLYASDCIGASYTFLMIELGLTIRDIEVKREDCARNLRRTIYSLLLVWRQAHPKQATLTVLLDTAKFLGMNTDEMVSKFNAKLTFKL